MENVMNGTDLVVKINLGGTDKVIVCSTSCTLSANVDTIEVACKNDGSGSATGKWKNILPGNKSWEVSAEALYVESSTSGATARDLFNEMVSGNKVSLTFSKKSTATGDLLYTGEAYITSWSVNAPDGDVSTFSATFTGTGELTASAEA